MQNLTEMVNNYSNVGNSKLNKNNLNLLFSGILSGFFISIGAFASQVLTVKMNNGAIGAMVFPLGLFLVVTVQTELFTGNCLLFINLFKDFKQFLKIIKNLIIVFIANSAGAHIFGLLIYKILTDDEIKNVIETAALNKVSKTPEELIISGILCNVIVCISVFLAVNVSSIVEKFCAVYLAIYVFVLCGFEHCVANMYTVFLGLIYSGNNGIIAYNYNIFFVAIGNIIGGFVLSILLLLSTKKFIFKNKK